MTFHKKLHWLLYFLFVLSCAKQSTPTGGPKDTIPPTLIGSNPKHEQINYDGKTLELEFSEAVSLNNPKEQLIITPSVGKEFKVEARKNKILLSLENPLVDSTTYTFNFREAVQDITERNPAENLQVAISTGSYIDSLSISGNVFNITNQTPVSDATVAIQPYIDTFNILIHPATYFTKSDKKGTFKIQNLKPGLYKVHAFTDQNKNLTVDARNEAYGFKRDSFLLDQNLEKVSLGLLRLDPRPVKLTSARPYNSYFNIKTSKNLKDAKVIATDSSDIYYTFGADQANVQVYKGQVKLDSIPIKFVAADSVGNKIDTTLYAKFSSRETTPEKFEYTLQQSSITAQKGLISLAIKFTKPVREINFDSIYYQVDSTTIVRFQPTDIQYSETQRILSVTKKVDPRLFEKKAETPEGSTSPRPPRQSAPTNRDSADFKKEPPKKIITNQLTIGRGSFISVENDTSKSLIQNITPAAFEDLGVILAETTPGPQKVIIQLVTKDLKIVRTVTHKTKATFEDLEPGEYQLRIIVDRNGNGTWDPGNYLKQSEPEEIYYWKDEKGQKDIKLKANFEHGPLLITY
jgi:uncharacterized protein (DUF2141 family)